MTQADPRRTRRLLAGLVLLLAGSLSACSDAAGEAGAPAAEQPSAPPLSYVALGDSFTAAPFVPGTELADGCFRSSGNYPALVADELGAELDDVSCSAAATENVTAPQKMSFEQVKGAVPPQLRSVRRSTDLVTIGIGGNDENLFATLVHRCTALAGQPGAPCTDLLRDSYGDPATTFQVIGRRVTTVLDTISRKAPDATVVLVGYPRLVDVDRPCPAMPLAAGDVPLVAQLEQQLNRTLAGAARAAGVEYVDMYAASRGHEICSTDPWVNGRVTKDQKALAYHPFAAGQEAVAEQLLDLPPVRALG